MNHHSPHKIVSTLEALTSSIDHDGQVYRWFAFLVTQPPVRLKFTEDKEGKELYRKLEQAGTAQAGMLILSLGCIVWIFYAQQYIYLGPSLILIYLMISLRNVRRRCVKEISHRLLEQDFDRFELTQKTFYQLSEIYSRKYNIPSFVDAVYFADNITRKSILFTIFCLPFTIPFNFWQALVILVGAYYLPYILANHPAVYQRLK